MAPDHTLPGSIGLWWSYVPQLAGHKIGCIGECESVAQIREAESILCDQGCTLAIGPMNGSTWAKHRAVIESDGSPAFPLEPTAAPVFRDADYGILATYSSSRINLTCDHRPNPALQNRLRRAGVTVRNLRVAELDDELRSIYRLSLTAFAGNFLYTPVPEQSFLTMYQSFASQLTPGCAFLAESGGDLVGFVFGYRTSHAVIVKTLAVLPERRFAGLGTLLVDAIQQAARSDGFTTAIHALQREDNSSLRISKRFSAEVFRRYALFSNVL